MLKVSKVIEHIERLYDVKLFDYQKDLLKHIVAGDIIYTPRCCGRSMLYEGYADYLKNVVGKGTDYSVNPSDFDKVYTYKDVPCNTLYSNETLEKWKKENMILFEREYECKYGSNDNEKVEVIKRGSDRKFVTQCKNCMSELRYSLSNVEEGRFDYNCGRDYYKYIICPECGEKIGVEL